MLGKLLFGTWQRGLAILLVGSLTAAHYFPKEIWPVLDPLIQTTIILFGIRVMLIPYWPLKKAKKKKSKS